MNERKSRKGGRNPKQDPATHCVMVRFNEQEFARMLTLWERSGVKSRAVFVKARVFDQSFRVITIDRTLTDYYQKLSEMFAQFRGIGTNYNQITKELKSHFSEKKALAMLYKLECETQKLVDIGREIIALTNQYQDKWSQK